MTNTKTITFPEPITFGAQTYDSIELREPTSGELEKASNAANQVGVVISLAALIAKVPRRVIENTPQSVLNEISDFLGSFGQSEPAETPQE